MRFDFNTLTLLQALNMYSDLVKKICGAYSGCGPIGGNTRRVSLICDKSLCKFVTKANLRAKRAPCDKVVTNANQGIADRGGARLSDTCHGVFVTHVSK